MSYQQQGSAPVSVYTGKFFQEKTTSLRSGNRGKRRSGKLWKVWMIVKKTLFTPLGNREVSSRQKKNRRRSENKSDQNQAVCDPHSCSNNIKDDVFEDSLFIEPSWQNIPGVGTDYYAPYNQDLQQQPWIDQPQYMNGGDNYWDQDTTGYFQDRPHSLTSSSTNNYSMHQRPRF